MADSGEDKVAGGSRDASMSGLEDGLARLRESVESRTQQLQQSLEELRTIGDGLPHDKERRKSAAVIESMIVNGAMGFAVGGGVSLLALKRRSPRLVVTSFATGFGMGKAFQG